MTYSRLTRLGLTVALVAASAAATAADTVSADEAKSAQAVIELLKKGDAAGAVARLGPAPQSDGLASHPELVHVICDRAFRFDRAKPETAPARTALAARLVELATAALAVAPNDDRARWALAEATVLRERAGPRTGCAAWMQASELLEKVHAGHPGDGLPLAYAVAFLLEGSCAEPDSAIPFSNRAEALAKKAMDSQKDSPTLAVTIASSQLWAARAQLGVNRKASRTDAKSALETLRPFAVRAVPSFEAATVFNDVVAFGMANTFGFPDHFVMAPRQTLDLKLEFDLPVSTRWSFSQVAATETTEAYDYVTEMGAEGVRRRQVLFRRYVWGQQYSFEGTNPCGGDNVRSIAQGLATMSAARIFAPGAKVESAERKPFCKELDGYAFDVRGQTQGEGGKSGEPLRLYGFVVRGHNQACYAVLVYVYGADDSEGFEMEALVSSLREPDK